MKTPALLYYPDFYPKAAWLRAVLLLVDEVKRIVPDDAEVDDPDPLKEIASEIGGLTNIAPDEEQVNPDGDAKEWLAKTLRIIGTESAAKKSPKRIEILISPNGDIEFPGRVFLYDRKLSDLVRNLLEENGLIDHRAQKFADKIGQKRPTTLVDAAASNAVLSVLASRVARDEGLTPITDQPLDFAMNALSGLHLPVRPHSGTAEGVLTAAFVKILVPKEIGDIRFSDYKILRYYSEGLRDAFGRYVQECHNTYRLDRIGSRGRLQERVLRCAQEVEEEFNKFQRASNKALRLARNWGSLALGGLFAIAKEYVPPEWSVPVVAGALLVQVADKVFIRKDAGGGEKLFHLSAEMGSNIRALLPRVSQLVDS